MPSGVQRYERTKMVLPVRFWPDDENGPNAGPQLAHTVDISPIGGRLGGLRNPLQPGQTIMLQRGQNKFQFRVVWSEQIGPGEIRAGIESVVFERKVWGVDLPEQPVAPGSSHTRDNLAISTPHSSAGPRRECPQPRWVLSPVAQLTNLRTRSIAIAASLLLAVSVLAFVSFQILKNSGQAATIALPKWTPAVIVPAPVVSTNPRTYCDVRVTFHKKETGSGPNRLQVAEAPLGHVIIPAAPDANLTGKVGMNVVIATDGRVKEIQVLGGNRILAVAAVEAVRFWRYAHHQLNGEAVEAETSVTISFHGQDAVSISFPFALRNNGLALRPVSSQAGATPRWSGKMLQPSLCERHFNRV
jgi:hypothetical protein